MQEFVLLKHNANRDEWTTEWLIKILKLINNS